MTHMLNELREPYMNSVQKNRLQKDDQAIHGWYRFVLGYPPHLVRHYLEVLKADPETDFVLDPFSGTATTPVEARLQGFSVAGIDANPIGALATQTKLNWTIDTEALKRSLETITCLVEDVFNLQNLPITAVSGDQQVLFEKATLPYAGLTKYVSLQEQEKILTDEAKAIIPSGFISPLPLRRVLAIRFAIETATVHQEAYHFFQIALANVIVSTAGNLGFGPEVYRTAPKEDADVLGAFYTTAQRMLQDLRELQSSLSYPYPTAAAFLDDARKLNVLKTCPLVKVVITSPPYPNEKDYTRSTRLESVLLGLVNNKKDLRCVKQRLLRSNTRNVFVQDDDDQYIQDVASVNKVADEIEARRIELGKTSGFEKLYHRVTRLYFGGMYRHLASLKPYLHPDARLAYVVGDQMSYFRIPIKTAELLADIAKKAGYCVEGIELWRTRRSTTTRLDIAENVLLLRNQ